MNFTQQPDYSAVLLPGVAVDVAQNFRARSWDRRSNGSNKQRVSWLSFSRHPPDR